MRVLIVGSGGREHALAQCISKSPRLTALYCAPGNPGTASIAENVDLNPMNSGALALWALEHKIDLTIVGPEGPLEVGIVDIFEEHGLRIFGPRKAAARLETSKIFAKSLMLKADVRTAHGAVFASYEDACRYVEKKGAPIVVKADGLCKGKGVVVAQSVEEALAVLKEFMCEKKFGPAGTRVVIEECLVGREATVMALVDGKTVLPLVVSQDFKRLKEGDIGPNTGGMGAISPTPVLAEKRLQNLVGEIFVPILTELLAEGIAYRGFLYAGVLVDRTGDVNVLEFNTRLGDPEAQVVLMRLESDLLSTIDAAMDGRLPFVDLRWSPESAVCVVLAAPGYPEDPAVGAPVRGLFSPEKDLVVFHAGTTADAAGETKVSGGRVVGVTARSGTMVEALERVYEGVGRISFEGMQFRRDIGAAYPEKL